MKISKGTIVRAVMLIIVIANMLARKMSGSDVFFVEEGTVAEVIETIISIAIIITAYWKNNSYSDKAIKADEFLKKLKESEEK